jgi:transposase
MRTNTILTQVLGIEKTRVCNVAFDEGRLLLTVRPTTRAPRCGSCTRRCRKVHDRRRRRWRHLDVFGAQCWLQAELRRVRCSRCGVTTEAVPWAAHATGFTYAFEQTVAFLAQRADKTAVSTMMRVSWETVGLVAARVVERSQLCDPLDGLRNISVDELSWRKHHRYITVVIDQDRGHVVWAAPGKDAKTLLSFFEQLGKERAELIRTVSADLSGAFTKAIKEACPNATIVYDRFHVQRLAHDALDSVRREEVRGAEGADAKSIKHTRWALQKNPWNMSAIDSSKLRDVQRDNKRLYRAYLLKEVLAAVLDRQQPNVAREKLLDWCGWAARSQLASFRRVAKTIKLHLDGIVAYVRTGLSNGRHEGLNGKARTITRRSYGFHSPHALIGLIMLCCTGLVLTPAFHDVLPLKG